MNEKTEKVAEHRYMVLADGVPFGKANSMIGVGEMLKDLSENTNSEIEVRTIH